MSEELLSGLQNAIARGASPEKAAQSFINAGYSAQEVQRAVQQLGAGVTALTQPNVLPKVTTQALATTPLVLPVTKLQEVPVSPPIAQPTITLEKQDEKKPNVWKGVMIALAVVIVLLIILLILMMIFGQDILKYLSG